MKLLEIEHLKKSFGGIEVLSDLSMSVSEGEVVAVLGPSGSGKSTLLHILGGLDKPTKGAIFLEGENISALRGNALALVRRRRIGFVFQSYNLLEEHTVMENILLPIHLDGRRPDMEFIDQVVDALGIRDKLSSYPDELSGGQKQRVAIARALAPKPAILLADEPTGNLDDKTSREVMELLGKSAREFGQTMVLVTHDREIASQADRVVTIADGRIQSIQEGKYGY